MRYKTMDSFGDCEMSRLASCGLFVGQCLFVLARAVNAAGPGDVLWKPGANR